MYFEESGPSSETLTQALGFYPALYNGQSVYTSGIPFLCPALSQSLIFSISSSVSEYLSIIPCASPDSHRRHRHGRRGWIRNGRRVDRGCFFCVRRRIRTGSGRRGTTGRALVSRQYCHRRSVCGSGHVLPRAEDGVYGVWVVRGCCQYCVYGE